MATFSVCFLGCKVSHTDAQEVRERLLGDGHVERPQRFDADVAVVNTCCVTHEAVRKSRHAAARAARTHRRVYVTGCGANLSADGFAGLPENVVVVARRSEETPDAVAGDVGAIGCVRADARLERVRAFVKGQDGCSFSCVFCVIPFVRRALRRLAPLRDFNLTSDVIVGFPDEDEAAFVRTLDLVREAGISNVHVFPYSPRPGTATAAADMVPAAVKRDRSERLRELSRVTSLERWHAKVGHEDAVLVDRPGRGYGDDYSPWLVRGRVGELVRVRGCAVTEEGILAA